MIDKTKPRLEITWEPLNPPRDGSNSIAYYELVLPLDELDIRNTDRKPARKRTTKRVYKDREGNLRIPLGGTYSSATMESHFRSLHTPFRDGAHAQWDGKKLNLPAYVIAGDNVQKIESRE
jgi:hypothetical protein